MKNIFALLTLLGGTLNTLLAQPIITSDILFSIGDEAVVHYSETPFNPGPEGAMVSWDFSDLSTSYTINWSSLAPGDTPVQDSFSQATIAFYLPPDEPGNSTDNYAFYQQEGNVFNYLGSVLIGAASDTSYFTLSGNADELYQFPLAFGDNYTDDLAGTNTIKVGNMFFTTDRSGTSTTEVDAYGDLQTPAGTFTNVLRVKRTESIMDDFNGIITSQEIVRYDWMSPDYEYILLHTEEIIIYDFQGNEQSRSNQTYYAEPSLINSISNHPAAPIPLSLYPNPVGDQLVISLPENQQNALMGYRIYDQLGQLIVQKNFLDFNAPLNVASLTPGTYFIEAWNKENRYQQRFIKQ